MTSSQSHLTHNNHQNTVSPLSSNTGQIAPAWEAVIGLEVHIQLKTRSKLFSGASTAFGAAPNTQACIVDLGLPGVLPIFNEAVINMVIRFALSIRAKIARRSIFSRKNYFYPDLPKGYQISQYDQPVVYDGHLDVEQEDHSYRSIPIVRAHLEEDAGKSLHDPIHHVSAIDLNRAGIPLLEIVTAPVMHSAKEAIAYLKTLHTLVCYLDICDGNLQEGSFRCDTNVSVRPQGSSILGTRTELKNINSFRFIEQATEYEIKRQIDLLENGKTIQQETRLYDPKKNVTRSMRTKEDAHDYRYFPDPDLLPLVIEEACIEAAKKTLPELPQQKRERFITQYGLSHYDANLLVQNKATANYYESMIETAMFHVKQHNKLDTTFAEKIYKLAANWMISELFREINKANASIEHSPVTQEELGQLIAYIATGQLSGKNAKHVFTLLLDQSHATIDAIVETHGLKQIDNDSAIDACIDQVMNTHPEKVMEFRSGKEKLFGFFVGLVMKASNGQFDPLKLNTLLRKKLEGS